MKLTELKLRALTEPGKHFDGGGLYLEVTKAGGRYWRMKYRFGGKEKRLAFGVYPEVSLKAARDLAAMARKTLASEQDPGAIRKEAKVQQARDQANTLQRVALDWIKHQSSRWSEGHRDRIKDSLADDIFPTLGHRPMASIKPGEVMAAIKAIEQRGAGETAGRVLQRVKAIYRWAVTHGRLDSNPMLDLVPGEILKPRQTRHRAAMPEKDMPLFLRKLEEYRTVADPITTMALHLLVLTAVRPGEVRGARWVEFDLSAALWTIPPERMKMKVEHRVPLSRQALAVLQQAQPLSGARDLVFPSSHYQSKDKPLSENTLNSALARMGFKGSATAHGFRATFSTVANEHGWDADVIERQLAHKERNEIRAAYHRSTYLKDRAKLMQWWADWLDDQAKKHTP